MVVALLLGLLIKSISCLTLSQKFRAYMKDEKTEPTKLLQELIRLDRFLESRGTKFLCGDQMTFADCELLPKLQHIRVATKVRDMKLPSPLDGVATKSYIQ